MRTDVACLEKALENRHHDVMTVDLVPGSQQEEIQGYLFKRTNNAFKTWNRRYFTLLNNQLVYRKRSGTVIFYFLIYENLITPGF